MNAAELREAIERIIADGEGNKAGRIAWLCRSHMWALDRLAMMTAYQ